MSVLWAICTRLSSLHAFAYVGGTHGGTVYAGVGTDLNVVLDGDDADLWYFVILLCLCIGCKAKAVGTDYGTGVEHDIVAKTAVVVDGHVGIEQTVVAHLYVLHDGDAWINLAVVANLYAFGNICECTYIAIVAQLGFW